MATIRDIKNAAGEKVEFGKDVVYQIDPEQIIIDHELNGRSVAPDLKGLVESIKEHGQLQPAIARKVSGGQLQLVAGYGRAEAIKEINKGRKDDQRMPLAVVVQEMNDEEAFVRNLRENLDRNQTTPIDDAQNCRRLAEQYGKSNKEIAKLLGKTDTWVRNTVKLLQLDAKTQSLLNKGELTWSAGVMLAEVAEEKRKEIVEKLSAEAEEDHKKAVERAQAEAEKSAKKSVKDTQAAQAELDASPSRVAPVNVPAAKIPTKKIDTEKVAKEVREAGAGSAKTAPNRAAIRDLLEGMTGPGEPELLRKTSEILLSFLSGKTSDQTTEKKLRKLLDLTIVEGE